MMTMINLKSILVLILAGLLVLTQQQVQSLHKDLKGGISPVPKIVVLNLDSSGYQSIFHGAPETLLFHSGLVTLQPDESAGIHNTQNYEEMIIVLEGEGQLIINKGYFQLKYGLVAYCPPHTEHNVKNTGIKPMKYIYIAVKTN